MKNYRFALVLFAALSIYSLINVTTNWFEIVPEQKIEVLLAVGYVAITFSGLFFVMGIAMTIGKPKDSMPPTNEVLKVVYIKMIEEEKSREKFVILLESEENITTTYELPITVFKRTENFQKMVGLQIRNVYGTIEEVEPQPL